MQVDVQVGVGALAELGFHVGAVDVRGPGVVDAVVEPAEAEVDAVGHIGFREGAELEGFWVVSGDVGSFSERKGCMPGTAHLSVNHGLVDVLLLVCGADDVEEGPDADRGGVGVRCLPAPDPRAVFMQSHVRIFQLAAGLFGAANPFRNALSGGNVHKKKGCQDREDRPEDWESPHADGVERRFL